MFRKSPHQPRGQSLGMEADQERSSSAKNIFAIKELDSSMGAELPKTATTRGRNDRKRHCQVTNFVALRNRSHERGN
jgi:hypothetical protein